MPTKISWTDETWSPITGCTPVSVGCQNCYAARMASGRLKNHPHYQGLTANGNWTGEVRLNPDMLESPFRWRNPRMCFVCSMSDLFHKDVPDDFIDKVFAAMILAQDHTFQVLTKRPERMRWYLKDEAHPFLNVWLGVTVENQETADERIPILLDTPAAVRFVSAEPLLGPLSFRWAKWHKILATEPGEKINHLDGLRMLDWIIVGGESGPKARPMHPKWALDIRDQCVEAGVPFHFKQWGEWAPIQYVGQDGEPYLCISCGRDGKKERVMPAFEKEDGKEAFHVNMQRVGKKAAGRELGGRTWEEYPDV